MSVPSFPLLFAQILDLQVVGAQMQRGLIFVEHVVCAMNFAQWYTTVIYSNQQSAEIWGFFEEDISFLHTFYKYGNWGLERLKPHSWQVSEQELELTYNGLQTDFFPVIPFLKGEDKRSMVTATYFSYYFVRWIIFSISFYKSLLLSLYSILIG